MAASPSSARLDHTFLELPLHRLADTALSRAYDLGADHADFRLERVRSQHLSARDGALQGSQEDADLGFAVRVLVDGVWGFAATTDISRDAAITTAEAAVRAAQVSAPMCSTRVSLAPEPAYPDVTWVSAYAVDPFEISLSDKSALVCDWTSRLLAGAGVEHAAASVELVHENKFYADLSGTRITQQRIRLEPHIEAFGSYGDLFDSMVALVPAAGRGWEYLSDNDLVDSELDRLPHLLADKLRAPSVAAGSYDLVIDPTNLWLTIHESIGHATELDRALGYEANYAGTSFATPNHLGTLVYGSPLMNVTGDRTVDHGLASVGYDDEGVEAQSWDIVKNGIFVGYQLDRSMATSRSNGCAYADSPGHFPIQRMANVSLQPDPHGPDTDGLIAQVERGLYIVGDKSWSIDMQRYNFQFTGQRAYLIRDGELEGQVRDFAYQSTTTDFWGSMSAVGGPQTYVLGGAFNCGKAQPGQVAAVSHGCPSALFRDVRVLNTAAEGGAS